MNARNLLICAIAATAMAALCARTQAQDQDYIYCKVFVTNSSGHLAVDLPGNPTWDLGVVAQGGVADTWYDASGKASYMVKNSGDTWADIYITAEANDDDGPFAGSDPTIPVTVMLPSPNAYAMAFATNVMDILPAWNLLDIPLANSMMMPGSLTQVGKLLREKTLPGEYTVFDLKFYAPTMVQGDYIFRVGFYAIAVGGDPQTIPAPIDPWP